MRPAAALAAALAGAVLLAACGDDENGGDGPDAGADPVVEVVDPGLEPRRELRLDPGRNDRTEATMTMDTTFEGTLDGQQLPSEEIPTITFGMELSIDEATSDRIDATFAYKDVEVGESSDPAVAAGIERTLQGFDRISGALSTTASGQLIEAELDAPEDLDPAVAALTQQMEEQFRSITVPFPQEPVGENAVWTVKTAVEIAGAVSDLEATYTLEDLQGESYRLAVEIEQTTRPGELEDGSGEIVSGSTSGTGQIEGELGALFPVRSRAESQGNVVIQVPGEGGEQELDQDIGVDVTFETDD